MASFTDYIRGLRKGLVNSKTISGVELKQKRVEVFQEQRKTKRDQVLAARRHMVNNTEDLEDVEEAASSTSKTMSRLERLAQWKADRQKKKLAAAKKIKPIFKVCALSTPIGLPDLENVNRQIKGKLIVNEKSKFAPKNHQFKPPANIKPIYFDNNTKDKPSRGDLVSSGVKTRAQTTVNLSSKENITNSTNSLRSTDKRIPLQRKSKKRKHESPQTVGIAANVQETRQGSPKKRIRTATRAQNKTLENLPELPANAENIADKETIKPEQAPRKKQIRSVAKTASKTSQSLSALLESVEKIEDTDGTVQEVDGSKQQVSRIIKTPKKSKVDDREIKQSSSRKRISHITKTPNKASRRSVNVQETEDDDTEIEETEQTVSKKRGKNVTKTPRNSPNGATKTPKLMENTTKSETENNIDEVDKDTKTPAKSVTNRNEDAPIYISPFVTLSRGKDNARKEYAARQARSDLSPNDESSKYTSPAAAASYFTKLLKNHICRLESLIDGWTEYKATENLSEDAEAMIDVAIGQTKLLIKEKAQQFQQLIDTSVDPDNPEPIRCTDLHGFWDLLFLQISKILARYDNLDKMKSNNWNDFLPEIKKSLSPKRKVVKKQKRVKATSTLRQAILAARKKKQEQEQQSCKMNGEIGETAIVVTPGRKTPQRKSLVTVLQNSEMKNRRSSSPGLTMMKVTRISKSFTPHGKGILKDTTGKSTGKTKTVIFQDGSNNESNLNASNHWPVDDTTVLRRSARLSKVKLFD